MGIFGDDGQIADLRITIDLAENPGFAANATVTPDASMRPVHLSHIADPRLALVVEVFLALYIPAEIAAPAGTAGATGSPGPRQAVLLVIWKTTNGESRRRKRRLPLGRTTRKA